MSYRLLPSTALCVLLAACGGGHRGPGTNPVGGTVSGLSGSGLVLQNNGGDNLAVTSNGAFQFSTAVPSGNSFSISILTQPSNPAQTCVVGNGSGQSGATSVSAVSIACTTRTFTVGGSVAGLSGSGLVLHNGTDSVAIGADGAFSFPEPVASGTTLAITVAAQPTGPSQHCTVSNAAAPITSADYNSVRVECAAVARFALFTTTAIGQLSPAPTGVSVLKIDETSGALTLVSGSPFAAGTSTWWVAVDPLSRFAYAVNKDSHDISAYAIASNGVLTPAAGSPFTTDTNPTFITVDPQSRFLYLVADGGISGFTLDAATGSLSPITSTPMAAGTGPARILIEPSGRYLYVTNTGSNNISAFAIDATTGALTPVPGSPFTTGDSPGTVSADSTGKFVYVSNCWPQGQCDGTGSISAFAIQAANGALTAVGSPTAPDHYGFGPFATAPTSDFAFLEETGTGNEWTFSIEPSSGALQTVSTQRYGDLTGYSIALLVEPSGKFAYIWDTTGTDDGIRGYSIDPATGAFASLPGDPRFAFSGHIASFILAK